MNADKNGSDKVEKADGETGKKEAATLDDDKEEILISGVLEKGTLTYDICTFGWS